jgi:hypothetical protein
VGRNAETKAPVLVSSRASAALTIARPVRPVSRESDRAIGYARPQVFARWRKKSRRNGFFATTGQQSAPSPEGHAITAAREADYDQQPVEACAMVSACLDANRATGQVRWTRWARTAFDWFLGGNVLKDRSMTRRREVAATGCGTRFACTTAPQTPASRWPPKRPANLGLARESREQVAARAPVARQPYAAYSAVPSKRRTREQTLEPMVPAQSSVP